LLRGFLTNKTPQEKMEERYIINIDGQIRTTDERPERCYSGIKYGWNTDFYLVKSIRAHANEIEIIPALPPMTTQAMGRLAENIAITNLTVAGYYELAHHPNIGPVDIAGHDPNGKPVKLDVKKVCMMIGAQMASVSMRRDRTEITKPYNHEILLYYVDIATGVSGFYEDKEEMCSRVWYLIKNHEEIRELKLL
jgi:hypothetical protein